MPTTSPSTLSDLQSNSQNIRNICIIAHVDHGKTTLSDSLISSNGIISQKLAGKIKYLDNRPDEQERGITMKSSCISLLYQHRTLSQDFLINLIDSPGHVDFSSEVSTAVRLSDGALVVVDVLEGVCIQTSVVLRQAWTEKVKPCLIINKIDRLFELQHTPEEAYNRIRVVLEQVNAVTGTLFSEDLLKSANENPVLDTENIIEGDLDEEEVYFSPEKGNVLFASGIDGWGFRIDHFCKLYAKKLGVKEEILKKTLWGEFYFNPKTTKIYKKNITGKMTPMFAQFVLQNIWQVYQAATENDTAKLEKIVSSLKLNIPSRELKSTNHRTVTEAIFTRWLPVADAVLEMVVDRLPSPKDAQAIRISKLWQPSMSLNPEISSKVKELKNLMVTCDSNPNSEMVSFVSKVVAVNSDSVLPVARQPVPRKVPGEEEHRINSQTAVTNAKEEPQEKFVAFARIFCGTIRRGQIVHVLGPRYSPSEPNKYHKTFEIKELYLLMGRNLEPVEMVPAGNVFGIGDVGDFIIKTATICTTPYCPVFNSMIFSSSPIVRVALEPEIPTEMPKLVEGLKLLNHADPSVKVLIQETGEHVIVTSGELHLERCLRDLKERFAKIKIRVSPPLVSFRETITSEPSLKYPTNPPGVKTANKLGQVKVTAIPLPENIRDLLIVNGGLIKRIFVDNSASLEGESDAVTFIEKLREEFKKAGGKWEQELEHLWAFGPRKSGPNILLNHIPGYWDSGQWNSISKSMFEESKQQSSTKEEQREIRLNEVPKIKDTKSGTEDEDDTSSIEQFTVISDKDKIGLLLELDNSIVNGFDLATSSGPLCGEPLAGVCFIVTDVILKESDDTKIDSRGPFGGQIMSATKGACWEAFLSKSVRLMEAMYTCDIQIASEFLGKMYAVLGRRRAKILKEEMKEGTYIYSIQALLPVVESFGLSEEILTQTSGAAGVQLLFSHWAVLDKDPFFVAHTEEQLEDIGENLGGVAPNIARQYIDGVRRRKGMPVEEQIVKFANKQRNLSKNK